MSKMTGTAQGGTMYYFCVFFSIGQNIPLDYKSTVDDFAWHKVVEV